MSARMNRQQLLVSRPRGAASLENFRLIEQPLPAIEAGQVLVRNRFLSVDPYMRGRMNDARSYAPPQPLDTVMGGGTVGEIVESRHESFAAGDSVVGMGGWQDYTLAAPEAIGLRRIEPRGIALSAYLGAVGMPGVTAWYGINRIIAPKAGETIVVSAAAGAVGGIAGQLAQQAGARAVGIAGGAQKCRYVTEELGFAACIDYRAHVDAASLARALEAVCPRGIDGIFENVGGMPLDAAMMRANTFSRVALCGLIAGYDGKPIPLAAPQPILTNRMRIEGFIISDHPQLWPQALGVLAEGVSAGRLRYRESIARGIEAAPQALLDVLAGRNLGKQLVELNPR